MRVIVCGGRNYASGSAMYHIHDVLMTLHHNTQITVLIEGGARGADAIARDWAKGMPGIKSVTVPALWNEYGKAAGPIRNQRMLNDFAPNLVVAFSGGAGTADMVRRARKAGIEVMECFGEPQEAPHANDKG